MADSQSLLKLMNIGCNAEVRSENYENERCRRKNIFDDLLAEAGYSAMN
jgi:hypothetical protein